MEEILSKLKEFEKQLDSNINGFTDKKFNFDAFYDYIMSLDGMKNILLKNNYFKKEYSYIEKDLYKLIYKVLQDGSTVIEEEMQKQLEAIYNRLLACIEKLANENFPVGALDLKKSDKTKVEQLVKKLLFSRTTIELKENLKSLPSKLNEINEDLWDKLSYTGFSEITSSLFERYFSEFIFDELAKNTFIYFDAKNAPLSIASTVEEILNKDLYKFSIENPKSYKSYERTLSFFLKHRVLTAKQEELYKNLLFRGKIKQAKVLIERIKEKLNVKNRENKNSDKKIKIEYVATTKQILIDNRPVSFTGKELQFFAEIYNDKFKKNKQPKRYYKDIVTQLKNKIGLDFIISNKNEFYKINEDIVDIIGFENALQ